MSVPHINLSPQPRPSVCQKSSNWWKFGEVLTKTSWEIFLAHSVICTDFLNNSLIFSGLWPPCSMTSWSTLSRQVFWAKLMRCTSALAVSAVSVYLQPFLCNTLFMCASQQNHKNTRTPYFGNSRSFKIINIYTNKSKSIVLVIISRMSVHICKRFHATPVNSSKITTFQRGYPSLIPACATLLKPRR